MPDAAPAPQAALRTRQEAVTPVNGVYMAAVHAGRFDDRKRDRPPHPVAAVRIHQPVGGDLRARITQSLEIFPQATARRITNAHPLHNLRVLNPAAAHVRLRHEVGAELMLIKNVDIVPKLLSAPVELGQRRLEIQPCNSTRRITSPSCPHPWQ